MSTQHYQAAVIGAGPGGYPCAIRLAQLGVKTVCIEKEHWGGVCLNVGCIPSKALITAAKHKADVAHWAEMGIDVPGPASVDMARLQAWKQGIVDKLTGGVQTLLKGNGADRLFGTARIVGRGTLEVTGAEGAVTTVIAENVVVATGSRPIQVPGFSFADDRVLDSTKALALQEVPRRLVVIGGGYIGLEMGTMFRNLGAEVTVVELQDQVLPGFDPEVVRVLARQLKRLGVEVLLQSKALGWTTEERGDHAVVRVETPKGVRDLPCDYVLVTVGRVPNTEGLGLDVVGAAMNGRFIQVDDQQRTNVPGLYAIGDVVGNPMLAHKATYEGEVAAEVIAGHRAVNDARTVPAVVFTDPEVATAGLQEHEATARGFQVRTGKMPFAANGRAMTTRETDGFVKVVLDAADNRVLGITIVGPHASDLISEAALAVEMDAEALDVGLTIHPHPTLGETVMEAAKAALGSAIHVMNKK